MEMMCDVPDFPFPGKSHKDKRPWFTWWYFIFLDIMAQQMVHCIDYSGHWGNVWHFFF